jgi:hypothetical protein
MQIGATLEWSGTHPVGVSVYGSGFTPGGTVVFTSYLFNGMNMQQIDSVQTTAEPLFTSCNGAPPGSCVPHQVNPDAGTFTAWMSITKKLTYSCYTLWVSALDRSSSKTFWTSVSNDFSCV